MHSPFVAVSDAECSGEQGSDGFPAELILALRYAQQRWYQPETGRFLSEDPVGATSVRLASPAGLHAFGYANANPLIFTDPFGLDVGQPESTSAKAQQEALGQANLNENNKDRGTWAEGCAAGLVDAWSNTDAASLKADSQSPEYLTGYLICKNKWRAGGAAYHDNAIAKNTREFWTATPERAGAMGCVLGGGSALVPAGDVASLPENMQASAGMCQFAVGGATAVMTGVELGAAGWRALKNLRPSPGLSPAFAGAPSEARGAVAAEEASAVKQTPHSFESRAGATAGGEEALSPNNYPVPDPAMSEPPVTYEPQSAEEVARMRQGKGPTTVKSHGNRNIEAHHRQQKPVKTGGVIDELEQSTHRGEGSHARHDQPSQLTPAERAREIREHWKKRGAEYVLPGEGI